MKMRHTASMAIALATLGMAGAAIAAPPITLNAGAGYWSFDGDRNLDSAATPWVSLEYAFTDNWAGEIGYNATDTEFNPTGGDVDVQNWQLELLHYWGDPLGKRGTLRPYIAFGGGEIDLDAGRVDTVETQINLGGGVRYMLTERLGIRAELKGFYSVDERQQDVLASVGLNWYIGSLANQVSAAAVAAAPVDSDGDGVTDDRDRCPGTEPGVRVDIEGCHIPVTRIAAIKLSVQFPFNSAEVEEQYFTDVSQLADFLRKFEELDVEIEGHTDDSGPEGYNQNLSERRARAVLDLLVDEYGIPSTRLRAVGYGESRPVADNSTREGRKENRRVIANVEVEYED